MINDDAGFVGSIPDLYDRNIGLLMMVPYAGDIAGRLSDMATEHCWKLQRAPASPLLRWHGHYRVPRLSPLT